MKCESIKLLLPALASGDVTKGDLELCSEHLSTCADCTGHLEGLKRTLALLNRVGQSEAPPFDFAARLHLRLAHEPTPTLPLAGRLWAWLEHMGIDSGPRIAMSLGATTILVLVLSLPLWRNAGNGSPNGHNGVALDQEVAAAFRVPQQKIAVVRFDFVADVEVQDVEFEVTLPSELHFIDEGQALPDRRLVWRGSLSSGSNPIPLAVRGNKPGRYRVTAQAHGAGLSVRHDILLEVVRS